MEPFSADDLASAREVVGSVARQTPVVPARWLSGLAGLPVLLKCENLQRSGSFKVRGATVRMSRLTPQERELGVVPLATTTELYEAIRDGRLAPTRLRISLRRGG